MVIQGPRTIKKDASSFPVKDSRTPEDFLKKKKESGTLLEPVEEKEPRKLYGLFPF